MMTDQYERYKILYTSYYNNAKENLDRQIDLLYYYKYHNYPQSRIENLQELIDILRAYVDSCKMLTHEEYLERARQLNILNKESGK